MPFLSSTAALEQDRVFRALLRDLFSRPSALTEQLCATCRSRSNARRAASLNLDRLRALRRRPRHDAPAAVVALAGALRSVGGGGRAGGLREEGVRGVAPRLQRRQAVLRRGPDLRRRRLDAGQREHLPRRAAAVPRPAPALVRAARSRGGRLRVVVLFFWRLTSGAGLFCFVLFGFESAGAAGNPYVPYAACCSHEDVCVEAEWMGYGRWCLPTPPTFYKAGERW